MLIAPRIFRFIDASPQIAVLVILALALGGFAPVLAAWPTDSHLNVPVCTAALEQDTPVTISDGLAGAIIVWAGAGSPRDMEAHSEQVRTRSTSPKADGCHRVCTWCA